MDRVCMYLRKSRADLEAESRGEGETLAKHRKALLKLAEHQGLPVIKIREEIVSGESLIHRPQMLELLKEVEEGAYDAVLCMDVDRLGRGNMQEQGLILDAFKRSKTKIITPRKVYDLSNEWDEEYSEFEAFMARKELKIITRRLQSGRIRSVEEGNYIATQPPYGYQIKKTDRERYLVPDPEQSIIVKMIFEWYTHENPQKRLGSNKIANELNQLGYTGPRGKLWNSYTVLNILKNAVYQGRLQWKKKQEKKSQILGKKKDVRTRPRSEWIDVEGKHEAIISPEIFQRTQAILKKKYHVPYQIVNGMTNPLAGLIKCGKCGYSMVYRSYSNQKAHIVCYKKNCSNRSSQFQYVENRLVEGLKEWLKNYKAEWDKRKPNKYVNDYELDIKKRAIQNIKRELEELLFQRGRLYDFFERRIYDEATYLERSQSITDRIGKNKELLDQIERGMKGDLEREILQQEMVPKVEQILDLYHRTNDPVKKNNLLKSILNHASYIKEKNQQGDDFSLTLYPKLPRDSLQRMD